jgi:hypothetical protein
MTDPKQERDDDHLKNKRTKRVRKKASGSDELRSNGGAGLGGYNNQGEDPYERKKAKKKPKKPKK